MNEKGFEFILFQDLEDLEEPVLGSAAGLIICCNGKVVD